MVILQHLLYLQNFVINQEIQKKKYEYRNLEKFKKKSVYQPSLEYLWTGWIRDPKGVLPPIKLWTLWTLSAIDCDRIWHFDASKFTFIRIFDCTNCKLKYNKTKKIFKKWLRILCSRTTFQKFADPSYFE